MNLFYLVVVCTLLAGRKGVVHGQYRWACTEQDDNGRRYIPSERDTEDVIAGGTENNLIHIYPVGNLTESCSGEVTAIEFCYRYTVSGEGEPYFNWTVLILGDMGRDSFMVNNIYTIESDPARLSSDSCTDSGTTRRCCDVQQITTFTLPTNFTFAFTGSTEGNTHGAVLLAFPDSLPQYRVNNMMLLNRDVHNTSLSVGSTLPNPMQQNQRGIRMLWFVIESSPGSTTTQPMPVNPTTQIMTVTTESGGPESTTTVGVVSTEDDSSTSPAGETTNTDSQQQLLQQTDLGPAIGGAVGGVIAVSLITVLVIIIVILAVKRGQMGSLKVRDNAGSAPGYNNALYATAADANGKEDNVKLQLDGRGNEGVSFSNISYEYVADTQTKGNELGHDYSLPTDVPRPALTGQTAKEAVPGNAFSDSNVYAAAYEVAVPQSQTLKSPGTGSSGYEEDIYMVPASDEHALYGQLSQIKIHTFTRDAIRLTGLLGSGQFGQVHRGEWTDKVSKVKNDVAVKMLKEGADELEKVKFLQEAAIMGQFSHPNVVKLYGVITEGEPVMLIIELLLKGDLRDILCAARTGQSSDLKVDSDLPHTLLSFCRQIAAGMAYLSSKAFVHRDLAARNILVSEDGTCKIADFGMSRDLADTDYYVSHGGKIPVKWTSPEALHFKKYSTASDVWSFGCVMYEIWSLGRKPFENLSNLECIKVVEKGLRLPPPPGCPRIVYRLMIDCWHPESSSRPDFVSIVQQLSLSDTKILRWSEEDKAAHPEASVLGAGLERATELYKDLQEQYTTK